MTKVELVTRTQGVGRYEGLSSGEIVEAVARHGAKKKYGRLIRFLMGHKHWSPLEHVHFSFRIETSRDVSAQMIRHRSFHWQELSQRYDTIQEVMPTELRKQGETNRQVGEEAFDPDIDFEFELNGGEIHTLAMKGSDIVQNTINQALNAYDQLIKAGVAKECARRILPMSSKTVVHMTGNLRDFLGFLNVRCEKHTQKEHRDVAMAIGEILEEEFPELKEIAWREGGFM